MSTARPATVSERLRWRPAGQAGAERLLAAAGSRATAGRGALAAISLSAVIGRKHDWPHRPATRREGSGAAYNWPGPVDGTVGWPHDDYPPRLAGRSNLEQQGTAIVGLATTAGDDRLRYRGGRAGADSSPRPISDDQSAFAAHIPPHPLGSATAGSPPPGGPASGDQRTSDWPADIISRSVPTVREPFFRNAERSAEPTDRIPPADGGYAAPPVTTDLVRRPASLPERVGRLADPPTGPFVLPGLRITPVTPGANGGSAPEPPAILEPGTGPREPGPGGRDDEPGSPRPAGRQTPAAAAPAIRRGEIDQVTGRVVSRLLRGQRLERERRGWS